MQLRSRCGRATSKCTPGPPYVSQPAHVGSGNETTARVKVELRTRAFCSEFCLKALGLVVDVQQAMAVLPYPSGTSFVSVEGRVQEIKSHKFTHMHQNHKNGLFHGLTALHLMHQNRKTWLTSPAYSSKSDGMSPHHVKIFRKQRNKSLIWCKSGLDTTLRSCIMGA